MDFWSLNFTSTVLLLQISSLFLCTFAARLTVNHFLTESMIMLMEEVGHSSAAASDLLVVSLLLKVFQQRCVQP